MLLSSQHFTSIMELLVYIIYLDGRAVGGTTCGRSSPAQSSYHLIPLKKAESFSLKFNRTASPYVPTSRDSAEFLSLQFGIPAWYSLSLRHSRYIHSTSLLLLYSKSSNYCFQVLLRHPRPQGLFPTGPGNEDGPASEQVGLNDTPNPFRWNLSRVGNETQRPALFVEQSTLSVSVSRDLKWDNRASLKQ